MALEKSLVSERIGFRKGVNNPVGLCGKAKAQLTWQVVSSP